MLQHTSLISSLLARKFNRMQKHFVSLPGEIWGTVPGWKNYAVSNLGRAKRLPGKTSNGHKWDGGLIVRKGKQPMITMIDGRYRMKREKISRLVLLVFVGPCPDGMEGCHNDDDSTNNRLENLRWDTHHNNVKDTIKNGKTKNNYITNGISDSRIGEHDPIPKGWWRGRTHTPKAFKAFSSLVRTRRSKRKEV